ncbi:O-antigen ligase family protein [Cognataquiflexum rubidum]|uniref:O-antigen ligase family protein n=1 Tax=Cognataquiflexum rubidum TaxID=2922273 RepID=UPI001F12E56E|nr:O-antigen ligase family protein [Cognataquiflexum rubidum]MCH6234483.1 O-antigen ligase family protein [Cognataquiflexum rubidum]
MKLEFIPKDHSAFLRKINWQLLLILLLMTACFFTWSENVVITRIIKVIGRMGMLAASWYVYRSIIQYGAADNLKTNNVLSISFYGLYLLLGFASFMWSTNVGYSALQWFMTSQTLVFCFFFVKSLYLLDQYFPKHPIRLYNLLGNSAFLLILVFVIGMWVNPDVFYRLTHGGEEARLGGYMMNPNELGMLAGVGVAGLMFDIRRNYNKWWTIVKLLILFYGLFATGSRSSLIGALLIIGFHVLQSEQKKFAIAAMVIMMMVAPIAIYKVVLKDGDPERMEEVLTLTGRLPFWQALINEGLPREPLLGFGFMRIDYKEYFQSAHTYPGKMTHNTFMQVLMNLGLVGMTLVLFQMIFTARGILREDAEKKLMLFCLLIPIIINSFTEFGVFGESNYGILFYQLVILYISFQAGKILTPRHRLHLVKMGRICLK